MMRTTFAAITALLAALSLSTPARAADEFKARLTGAAEVPAVATETSGKATIRFNQDETEAEFTLIVNDGIRITQAHIHCAPAGANGPILVFLAGLHAAGLNVDGKWVNNATFTNDSIVNAGSPQNNCGTTLPQLAQAMRDGKMYVNVHNVEFPGGVIRGQLEGN